MSWNSPDSEPLEASGAPESVSETAQAVEDATFARWFHGHDLRRTARSCRERGPDADAPVPPASHRLSVIGPSGDTSLDDVEGIEWLFRKADLRAANDDEMRDLAYLALFLLRQQHAELVAAPDPLDGSNEIRDISYRLRRVELDYDLQGVSPEIGSIPESPGRDGDLVEPRLAEAAPTAELLPDSDIFDKESYEIEPNPDGSSVIRGQRLTLRNHVFEVSIHFARDGTLARIELADTGEIIDPEIYTERDFILVAG